MKNLINVVLSVLSAMIGVQKKKNLVNDFNHVEKQGPWMFIIVGILMTILFVLSVVGVVNLVLP